MVRGRKDVRANSTDDWSTSVARRQDLRAVSIMCPDGPEPIQLPVSVDLVDDQAGFAVDHVGGRKRVVHAHPKPRVDRAANRPFDCKGSVGNDLDGRRPGVLRAVGICAGDAVRRGERKRLSIRRHGDGKKYERQKGSNHVDIPFVDWRAWP